MIATTKQRIEVSRLRTPAEVASLRNEWRQLEGCCAGMTPFSTWDWCEAAARYYGGGRPLWVMTARDDSEVIGIAPFGEKRVAGLRVLRALGSGLSAYSMADYQDLVLAEGREDEAIDALCDELADLPGWDALHIPELPAASQTAERLAKAAQQRGWRTALRPGSDVHSLSMDGSWDEYKMTLSQSRRHDFSRLLRKLGREHEVSFVSVDGDVEEISRAMSALFELHTQRWQSVGKAGVLDERRREFHREVARRFADRGMLAISLLGSREETAAVIYGFQMNGTRYYHLSGRSPDERWHGLRLGLVLDLAAIKDAFDQGACCVDLMRGEGDYKDHYRMQTRYNQDFMLFRGRRAEMQYRLALAGRRLGGKLRRKLAEAKAGSSKGE